MASTLVIVALLVIFGWPYICSAFATTNAFGKIISRAQTGEKVIALTFDDGPNPPYTTDLLSVLAKHDVKATFFVVGKNLLKFPEISRQIVSAGHTIANHSFSHSYFKYFLQPGFAQEVSRTTEVIFSQTGLRPALFRSPWLFRTPWFLGKIKSYGLTPIFGIFSSEREIFQPQAEKIAARALQKITPGAIIIFHDGFESSGGNREQTVAAVDLLIPKLKQSGYVFATVDELLSVPAYRAEK